MTTTEQALLVILSAALAVFLIVGIIVGIKLIKVLNQVQRIGDKAEQVVNNVEQAAETIQKTAGSMALFKVLGSINDFVQKKSSGK